MNTYRVTESSSETFVRAESASAAIVRVYPRARPEEDGTFCAEDKDLRIYAEYYEYEG